MSPAGSIWLPDVAARDATIALLEGVGLRATPATADDDARTLARLAEAGVVAVGAGEAPTADAIAVPGPREALAAVDHGREVASRPILVVGFARSGTTWVLELLGAHPRVRGLFETHVLTEDHLGHLRANPRLHPDGGLVADAHVAMPFGVGQLAPRHEVAATLRRTTLTWLARHVGPGHDWLVEKTPGHALTLEAIAEVLPEARVVHVVRDVRDVLVSRRAAPWQRPAPGRLFALGVARDWRRTLASVERVRGVLPVHEVRYERLHANPEEELARLYHFCGIPYDDGLVRRAVAENAFDRQGFERGQSAFRRAGRVGDHRTSLGAADRLLLAAAAGDLLAARGYTRGRGLVRRVAATLPRFRA